MKQILHNCFIASIFLFSTGCSTVSITPLLESHGEKPKACSLNQFAAREQIGVPYEELCVIRSAYPRYPWVEDQLFHAWENTFTSACACGADAIVFGKAISFEMIDVYAIRYKTDNYPVPAPTAAATVQAMLTCMSFPDRSYSLLEGRRMTDPKAEEKAQNVRKRE